MFLRRVELFRHCTTEQLIRIAEIARQEDVDVGASVYHRNQTADAMYCVLDGSVALNACDGGCSRVGEAETFGVAEILGDQLRSSEARPERPSRLLVIDADALLDLLSNNIEIVRSLFRQLLSDRRQADS